MNLGTQGLPSSQGAHVAIDNLLYMAYTYTFHIDINLNIRTPEVMGHKKRKMVGEYGLFWHDFSLDLSLWFTCAF